VLVVPANEETIVARETAKVVARAKAAEQATAK
jgi:acetate kinase